MDTNLLVESFAVPLVPTHWRRVTSTLVVDGPTDDGDMDHSWPRRIALPVDVVEVERHVPSLVRVTFPTDDRPLPAPDAAPDAAPETEEGDR